MDVFLDSNALVSDIRMKSIRFKNLFVHLRRTKSQLIILGVIREEAFAAYEALLREQIQSLEACAKEVGRLSGGELKVSVPDVAAFMKSSRKQFNAVAKAPLVMQLEDLSGVRVEDVFMRGVNRRRPANENGEELRDVILWLATLAYAKSTGKQVALITADGDFWRTEKKEKGEPSRIHPHLLEDLDKGRVTVVLHRSLNDFVRANSSASSPLKAEDLAFFNVATIFAEIEPSVRGMLQTSIWKFGAFDYSCESVTLHGARFVGANGYKIDQSTQFIEAIYEVGAQGTVTYRVMTDINQVGSFWDHRMSSEDQVNVISNPFASFYAPAGATGMISFANQEPMPNTVGNTLAGNARVTSPRVSGNDFFVHPTSGSFLISQTEGSRETELANIRVRVEVALRVVQGRMTELEVESIQKV